MLVSLNWLKEFVDTDKSAEEIAELLTMGGIEVESCTRVGTALRPVLTARVEEIGPHPHSDKGALHVVRLRCGSRDVTVVCGAPNVAVGRMVPYAPPGAVLPSGMEIVERDIKGVLSPGMICSEKELDLGDDASGIMVLEGVAETGISLTTAFPFVEDWILETSVTPNRGDCLSILGTAREVAALLGLPWRVPEFQLTEGSASIHDRMRIEVPDADLCPRYVARMVDGVTIGPSPFEVRLRVLRSGVRPISNVVDVTNLVLLECGQPLHAFDSMFLQDNAIVVRRCDPGEVFTTLDGQERKLPPNALMIRDGRRSVALAGIMGGLNSEIQDSTTSVLIESACFERFGVRRTAKALGMGTEASFRFERGVDPDGTLWAAHRSTYLMQKLAGGTILSGCIDVYPAAITRRPVSVSTRMVNRLLGLELDTARVSECLKRVGAVVESGSDGDSLTCTSPSWRWDLDRDVDMAEEVARVHGYQNIPVSMPTYTSAPDHTWESHDRSRRVIRVMNASGFSEAITMSFTSRTNAEEFVVKPDEYRELPLLNPITEDYTVMRPSLIPGLLGVLKRNLNYKNMDQRLFELGKTFTPLPGRELPQEDVRLAAIAIGRRDPEAWHFNRGEVDTAGKIVQRGAIDFYDMKGALENVLEGIGVDDVRLERSGIAFLHPGKSADVFAGDQWVGYIGELAPSKVREHELPESAFVFEILLEPLYALSRKQSVFRPIPRYPFVERDVSLIVERNCSGDQIKRLISRLGHDIISSVIFFDLYTGESVPLGRQSMSFRIRYQSEERTLTDEEVQEIHSHVVETLVKEFGAGLRA